MRIETKEENQDVLAEYEKIPIAFTVTSRLRVELINQGLGGLKFVEEPVEPYLKDYDAIDGEKPSTWAHWFDLSNWGVLSAFDDGQRIGGAAIAWNTPAIEMLEGRQDLACLWDIRVAPDYRGRGVGRQLFASVIDWARQKQCRRLRVETQNINVQACRFYASQGCELGAINRFGYPQLPDEIQLIWYRNL